MHESSRWQRSVSDWHYYFALLIPFTCLGFLLSAPHPAGEALLWLLPMAVPVAVDYFGLKAGHRVKVIGDPPGLALLPVLLAVLFISTTSMLLIQSQSWRWDSPQALADSLAALVVVKFLFGSNAAICGLIPAHELIHRRSPFAFALGRVLLLLCCYEHFATEHIYGHHRRVGRMDDPATARFGETYAQFWRRTVPAQFVSAWRLESRRLRLTPGLNRCWWRHRVLQGVIVEVGLIGAIGIGFGPAALAAFTVQALMAVRNLEAINYVQHWGLQRVVGRPCPQDAWRTDAWCSTYLLLGLARHAHHHCRPALSYYHLEDILSAPKLPYGYFALMFIVAYCNRSFQQAATIELKRLGVGPFVRESG